MIPGEEMRFDKARVHMNLTRDESVLDVESDSIVAINTSECAESLSAGGNKPANTETAHREVASSEHTRRNLEVIDELRFDLSRASCQDYISLESSVPPFPAWTQGPSSHFPGNTSGQNDS
jgi:hypothetical protein